MSGDVRDWLARGATRDERVVARRRSPAARGLAPSADEPRAIPAEHVAGEELGVERGVFRRNAGRDERCRARGRSAREAWASRRRFGGRGFLELFGREVGDRGVDQLVEPAFERDRRAGAW